MDKENLQKPQDIIFVTSFYETCQTHMTSFKRKLSNPFFIFDKFFFLELAKTIDITPVCGWEVG